MSSAKKQIEEMVQAIFNNRQNEEYKTIANEIGGIERNNSSGGMLQSGAHVLAVTRAYDAAVVRTVERTLEELSMNFRQAGRRDASLFWGIVEPKILQLGGSFQQSTLATAASKLRTQNTGSLARHASRSQVTIKQTIRARVRELRLKSEFIVLKTPDDRRANGVPDVAVMMWFPSLKTGQQEDIDAAKQRYDAIKEAVAEASKGLATVNKLDDPDVVSQDRISETTETWLEKATVVICDLTGHRQNVYYEFGYTRAIGTDVLLTCPTGEAEQIRFHLGQWQRVQYSDIVDLKTQLTEKLSALLPKYDLSGGNI